MFETSFHDALAALPEWDDIAATRGLYASSRWVRMFEEEFAGAYVAVRSHGRLVAVVPCYVARAPGTLPPASEPPKVLWLSEVDTATTFPFVHCGPPRGYSNHLLVRSELGATDRAAALRELLDGVRRLVAERGGRLFGFTFLPIDEALELLHLDPSLQPVYAGVDCVMDPVMSIEAYQASKVFRREMRLFTELGFHTEVHPLSAVAERATELVIARDRKYGVHGAAERTRREIQRWIADFDSDTRVVCAVKDDRIVGISGAVRCGSVFYGRFGGIDDSAPKRAAVYFNCAFYERVRVAQAEGIQAIHYGAGAVQAKVSRGCTIKPLVTVVGAAAGPWPDALRAAVVSKGRERLAKLHAELAAISADHLFPDVARQLDAILSNATGAM